MDTLVDILNDIITTIKHIDINNLPYKEYYMIQEIENSIYNMDTEGATPEDAYLNVDMTLELLSINTDYITYEDLISSTKDNYDFNTLTPKLENVLNITRRIAKEVNNG